MKSVAVLSCSLFLLMVAADPALASGFAVFTQGASGIGQANAVIAHPTGPSSLYFNPALLTDVPGRQVEVGTAGVYADRKIKLGSGGTEEGENDWDFPSTFYYTHQVSDSVTAGIGIFFPFGLSTEWDEDYAGRYLGTSADLFTTTVNPAVSFRVNDHLSVAAGVDVLYLDATLEKKINQTAAYTLTDLQLQALSGGALSLPPLVAPLGDIDQKFEGDGWGVGYNLGAVLKINDAVSIGAAYRSHIDVNVEGEASFRGVDPTLAGLGLFPDTDGDADVRLPQQATAGIAVKPLDNLVVEAGVRWEDWESTKELKVELDQPVFGQNADVTPRDWNATWTWNIGGQCRLNETVAINAGYVYAQNAVPSATFEPLVPDTDAHLFTVGTDLFFGSWTISGAFGYEHHENRDKNNTLGDAAGSAVATALSGVQTATGTANGTYEADVYLVGLSLGYRF